MEKKEKTWKREFAFVMVMFLGYLAATDRIDALEILAAPVFLFTIAAFGMDWGSKQTDLLKRK